MPTQSSWPVLDPGSFRHKIVIAQKVFTKSEESGEDQWTAETLFTLWASFEPERGKEIEQKDTTHAYQHFKFSMWYVAGVDTTMLVQFGGADYDIQSIDVMQGMNHFMILHCRKVE